jgi:DNA processing protein
MNDELLYQLCLTRVPGIGCVQAKQLLQHIPSAKEIFQTPVSVLSKIEGIGPAKCHAIQQFTDFTWAEKEIQFMDKYGITPFFITDDKYPNLLKQCYDPPTMLYFKGRSSFEGKRVVGIIGTRKASVYGKNITEALIESLSHPDILIVSGMAMGIDAIAHRSAIELGVHTIGVLAHSLDTIYPAQHHELAKKMMHDGGGLLTEFPSGVKADRHHFPTRNRIVAGLCDALVVIETSVSGGSMITASLAFNYHREVFAFPGRISDNNAQGCHKLIQQNKAMLVQSGDDIKQAMGWEMPSMQTANQTAIPFSELSETAQQILSKIKEIDLVHFNDLTRTLNIHANQISAILLQLELANRIELLPGNRIQFIQ